MDIVFLLTYVSVFVEYTCIEFTCENPELEMWTLHRQRIYYQIYSLGNFGVIARVKAHQQYSILHERRSTFKNTV